MGENATASAVGPHNGLLTLSTGVTLRLPTLETTLESLDALSNLINSSAALCCRTYNWIPQDPAGMGSRFVDRLDAIHPLLRSRI